MAAPLLTRLWVALLTGAAPPHGTVLKDTDTRTVLAAFVPGDAEVLLVGDHSSGNGVWFFATKGVGRWDAVTGERSCRHTLPAVTRTTASALSPDSRLIAIATARTRRGAGVPVHDVRVHFYDVRRDTFVGDWMPQVSPVYGLAFSPDGGTLAMAAGETSLWDARTRQRLGAVQGHFEQCPAGRAKPYPAANTAVAYADDGRTLMTGGTDGSVCVWDVATRTIRLTAPVHRDTVTAIVPLPGGRVLSFSSPEGSAVVFEAATGRVLVRLGGGASPLTAVAVVPGTDRVAGVHGRALDIYNSKDGSCEQTTQLPESEVSCIALSSDGRRAVVVGGPNGSHCKIVTLTVLPVGRAPKP